MRSDAIEFDHIIKIGGNRSKFVLFSVEVWEEKRLGLFSYARCVKQFPQ
jgi:hypothetical protein